MCPRLEMSVYKDAPLVDKDHTSHQLASNDLLFSICLYSAVLVLLLIANPGKARIASPPAHCRPQQHSAMLGQHSAIGPAQYRPYHGHRGFMVSYSSCSCALCSTCALLGRLAAVRPFADVDTRQADTAAGNAQVPRRMSNLL
jgi:hypothetical protein